MYREDIFFAPNLHSKGGGCTLLMRLRLSFRLCADVRALDYSLVDTPFIPAHTLERASFRRSDQRARVPHRGLVRRSRQMAGADRARTRRFVRHDAFLWQYPG